MSNIYNFQKVSDSLACAGQPREGQLASIAEDGYRVIINLGLVDGKYALADEAASVKALGLVYHHIPVQFDNPQLDELTAFITDMRQHDGENILVHCAANYRASAFTALYLLGEGKLNEEAMQEFIEQVWQPDGIWQQFIEESVEYLKQQL
ncbi:MAG: protein tyrosine phosphatase family protein [Sphingobacteriales bacterium]